MNENRIKAEFKNLKEKEDALREMSQEDRDKQRATSLAKLKPFVITITEGADASFLLSALMGVLCGIQPDAFGQGRRALFLLVKTMGIERGVEEFLKACGPSTSEFDQTPQPIPAFVKPLFIHIFNCMYGDSMNPKNDPTE